MTKLIQAIFNGRMLVSFMMGFACGLPLLLTISVLQAWMQQEGVDLTVIGLMALVGLPYTLKFLWAPVLDRFIPPFLGRRRGWLLLIQILLAVAIACLGLSQPAVNPWMVAFLALLVTFFSASQDIVVDAYRREDLSDEELGLGSSLYINGYRVGMLLASGGGLILADHIPFSMVYLIMAGCMLVGIVTTLLSREPEMSQGSPKSIKEAVIDPFVEYFTRAGWLWGLGVLGFILLYKIGDTMAAAMTTPFYLEIGFTKTQIGAVVKLFGFWATIAGGLAGGVILLKVGIYRGLWIFGFLQAVSTAGFAVLANIGPSLTGLAAVIAFENLASGMGTAAYAAYMASITNKRFTATQYALFSSLMGIPRVLAAAPTGFMAKYMGWSEFFIFCTLIAIPGMLMLIKFAPWNGKQAHIEY
jgi:PAT family beta-lactamase induction signal transducer AmpG